MSHLRQLTWHSTLTNPSSLSCCFQWITEAGSYHNFNTIVRPQNGPPDVYTQISQGVVGCFVIFSTAMENWESLRFSTMFICSRTAGHLIPILIFYSLYLVVEFILFVAFMLILRSETPIDGEKEPSA